MQNQLALKFIQENYLLLLIIFLGAFLRIFNLSGESIWFDEAVTSLVAEKSISELISWFINIDDNNPPLYYTFMHFWTSLFGHSETALRMPSAIFGTCSVLMIYLTANLIYNRTVGLIASLLLAISVFQIEYSQEARAYSLMAFLTLCSFYFFLKTLSGSKYLYLIGYVLSSVLLVYTHFYGVFILVVQNIFCFTNYFASRRLFKFSIQKWILSQIVIGIFFLPGLLLWYKNTQAMQGGFWLSRPELIDVVRYFYHFTGRNYILFFVFFALSLISFININNIAGSKNIKDILDISAGHSSNKLFSNLNAMYFLLLWLFVPILSPFIISQISTPILHSRYIIGASLALFIIVGKGIWNLKSKKISILIPLLILLLSIWPLYMYYVEPQKHQWRQVVSYIEKNAQENDTILVYPLFDVKTARYYKKRDDLTYVPLKPNHSGELSDRFWVVTGVFAMTSEEEAKNVRLKGYDLKRVKSFNRLNLYLYEKD